MKRLLLFIPLLIVVTACTPKVVRNATDNGFISPSSPELNFEFNDFNYIDEKTGTRPFKYVAYVWESLDGKSFIELTFINLKKSVSSQPVAKLETESLCAGTAYIENEGYRTQIRVHSSDTLIFKSYISRLDSKNHVKFYYKERIPVHKAKEYRAWKSEKNSIIYKKDPEAISKLDEKRQERIFQKILKFEKRADAIFNAKDITHFTPDMEK